MVEDAALCCGGAAPIATTAAVEGGLVEKLRDAATSSEGLLRSGR